MKRAKPAPPSPFAATEPSVQRWRSAGGSVAIARFAAAGQIVENNAGNAG